MNENDVDVVCLAMNVINSTFVFVLESERVLMRQQLRDPARPLLLMLSAEYE